MCPASGTGHEILVVENTATVTHEGDSHASYCLLLDKCREMETIHLCAPGIAGDRGKYNPNVQQQHPKCSYPLKLSPSSTCIITMHSSHPFCNSKCLPVGE